ncbi:glycine cleavage system protein T [Pseudomonas aeruginosa VRFPA09]|nr:glycine cleavage system protein T [Pseudomonas aeruginosa VRFPA09]
MTAETLAKTPLHALHLELGAKMVPFAGYDMPVQYPAGVLKEHLHTREQAGLFDVSHMGQIRLVGADAALALESLVPVDILDLPVGQQRYALFTDEQGGILDDLMVANLGDCLLLVVNAACKHQDLAHLRRHLEGRCSVEPLFEERALLALQGPAAVRVLERLAPQVAQMTFMQFARVELLGQDCYVSRSGYTGEDGYEISVPAAHAEALARRLLVAASVARAWQNTGRGAAQCCWSWRWARPRQSSAQRPVAGCGSWPCRPKRTRPLFSRRRTRSQSPAPYAAGAVQAARKACCEAGSRRSSLRRRRSRLRLRRWSSPVRSSTRMSAAPP